MLLVTWRANGIVLYMYEGKVLMDMKVSEKRETCLFVSFLHRCSKLFNFANWLSPPCLCGNIGSAYARLLRVNEPKDQAISISLVSSLAIGFVYLVRFLAVVMSLLANLCLYNI